MADTPRTSMYVVTNVTKINRKVYSVFRVNIGRALPLRSILYFLVGFGIMFALRHLRLIQYLFLWLPFTIAYFGIPVLTAYLLGDVGTEGRTPLALFKSFLQYHLRQREKVNYFRGKTVLKPVQYRFKGMPTYRIAQEEKEEYKGRTFVLKGSYSYNKNEVSK